MRHGLKIALILFVFLVVFIGGISFQLYTNVAQSTATIHDEERSAIDAIQTRPDVIAAKKDAEDRARTHEELKRELQRRNAAGEGPYIRGILNAEDRITEAYRPYRELVAKLEAQATQYYATRKAENSSLLGNFSGVQSGVSITVMAIFLALIAALYSDWQRPALMAVSFLCQLGACFLVFDGVLIKFGDGNIAVLFATIFFVAEPTIFHYGFQLMFNDMRPVVVNWTKQPQLPAQQNQELENGVEQSVSLETSLIPELVQECRRRELRPSIDNLLQVARDRGIDVSSRTTFYRKHKKEIEAATRG